MILKLKELIEELNKIKEMESEGNENKIKDVKKKNF